MNARWFAAWTTGLHPFAGPASPGRAGERPLFPVGGKFP
jgi:hypothetical protein